MKKQLEISQKNFVIPMSKLRTYLQQISPALSLSYIEREAGLPENTLRPFVRGDRSLANNHVFPLMKCLIRIFGVVQIDGWRYTSDEWDAVILASKDVDAPTSEEVESGGFIYHQKQYRKFHDSIGIAEMLNDGGSSAAEFLANCKNTMKKAYRLDNYKSNMGNFEGFFESFEEAVSEIPAGHIQSDEPEHGTMWQVIEFEYSGSDICSLPKSQAMKIWEDCKVLNTYYFTMQS
ncbi:hypothetical protein [Rhodoflexus caldus]|uniref:hypothetical protein n=1 Tax=Rhodoflexus caldus TaxID=2891236 RepID=UPI00202A3770|nr:hypothetical protein [Rhodoflexus caldus]